MAGVSAKWGVPMQPRTVHQGGDVGLEHELLKEEGSGRGAGWDKP